jgi:hypothetical protein
MAQPFTTFEITGVPGHSNILFHIGNYNKDSEGCVLLGRGITEAQSGDQMITMSNTTFKYFMDNQAGVDTFILTVKDKQ